MILSKNHTVSVNSIIGLSDIKHRRRRPMYRNVFWCYVRLSCTPTHRPIVSFYSCHCIVFSLCIFLDCAFSMIVQTAASANILHYIQH